MTDTTDRAWQGPSATASDVSATPMDAGEETGIGALGLATGPLVWRSHWRTGAWGLMALMLGAAFWHLVGFWSFLTSASFHGDQTKTHVAGHVSGYVADEAISAGRPDIARRELGASLRHFGVHAGLRAFVKRARWYARLSWKLATLQRVA